jgi:hypothetical protein
MLRFALIVGTVVVVLFVAILVATGRDWPGAGVTLFWVLILFLGIVFERRRYKRLLDEPPPGADWEPTSERFIDPETQAEVVVYFNPKTGARAYVRVGASSLN